MDLVQSEERSFERREREREGGREGGLRKGQLRASFVLSSDQLPQLFSSTPTAPTTLSRPSVAPLNHQNLSRALIKEQRNERSTHHEIHILLIRMPLKLQRQLIQIVHPDLRLVHSSSHSVMTVRCGSNLERSLGELEMLDELNMT